MKTILTTILLSIFLFLSINSIAQSERAFCRAVNKGNFKKIERKVKKVIRKNRKATLVDNGLGDTYLSCTPSLDSITAWINQLDCIEEAYWDKCQTKLAVFPGHSSIGIKVKVNNRTVEKCFLIHEGRIRKWNLFGYALFKSKTKLIYKKMYDCTGFIEQQKKNCEELNKITSFYHCSKCIQVFL